jgi:hypothetical protein
MLATVIISGGFGFLKSQAQRQPSLPALPIPHSRLVGSAWSTVIGSQQLFQRASGTFFRLRGQ